MSNKLQNYIPGVAFPTYVLFDLTATHPDDWTWGARTLAGYKTELCANIPLGGEITLNEQRSSISGIWKLNKYTLSTEGIGAAGVTLCCIGQSGGITMSISAVNNWCLPLADQNHPYVQNLSATQTSCITGFYLGTGVSVEIIPDEGTSIRSIKMQGLIDNSTQTADSLSEQDQYLSLAKTYDGQQDHIVDIPINSVIPVNAFGILDPLGYSGNGGIILSVDYVQGGVLEYFSNKNARNPSE